MANEQATPAKPAQWQMVRDSRPRNAHSCTRSASGLLAYGLWPMAWMGPFFLVAFVLVALGAYWGAWRRVLLALGGGSGCFGFGFGGAAVCCCSWGCAVNKPARRSSRRNKICLPTSLTAQASKQQRPLAVALRTCCFLASSKKMLNGKWR
jgi:hypothetical protein